ncbi:pyrroloquinoline quinone biosynthesis protein PqqE [Elioraea sp. Yellowstone]|uniref:pyrroloquinoline quinone biosynthesis protein PqqE n=1 Tax=Elioraea sp. Yellowstone TaxID=2592070 RepID=UPI0011500AD1|nr:pyrroloquinoline quinone biosynthesis protein PqqE [Elioraea sp. Yellowstone]TQF82797.1 pyrroloquinoline quinone biosynthesis protein PqqE [Elioraea sp. Yellowstone]
MTAPRPYTLVAELTYRCALRCGYCSNPLDWTERHDALATADWIRVLSEAEALGVMQVTLTGGEPLLRDDLDAIVAHGRRLELYQTLITSGVPLTRARLAGLRDAGLDAVQLSIQDADETRSDRIAGTRSFAHKRAVAAWVRELGLPLTLNVVLHRANLDHVPEIVALAEEWGAERLELANTQYLGWALANRDSLLPTRAQIDRARAEAAAARTRLKGRMEVLFVLPDYFTGRPKACMDGWARRFIVVGPDGTALPCHAAHTLPLEWWNVREHALNAIWRDNPGFNAYRGEDWMPEPCRSCDRRALDFGGCRCQAFALTGDAARTDPACALAPDHALVSNARPGEPDTQYRRGAPPPAPPARGRKAPGPRVTTPG